MPSIYLDSFWQAEEDALWTEMADIFVDAYMSGVAGGVETLPANARALVDFDYVNTRALEYAKQYRYELIKDITDTTRTQTQQAVSDWITSGQPLSTLETQLAPIYGEVRAGMIAATETTRIYAQANADAWESTDIVEEWQWMTARDDLVCPVCGGLDGETFGLADVDARPPAHVNCRCWEQPIVSEAAFERKLQEILK